MSPERADAQTVASKLFEGTFCDYIFYRLKVSRKEFDLDAFAKAVGGAEYVKEKEIGVVRCAPANESSDFYLRVSWRVDSDEFALLIDVNRGRKKPAPDEKAPWAEDFMPWVAKFFASKTLLAHIHAEFKYPATRQSRFPLPLTVAIGPPDSEAVIDGISFRLGSKPQGVDKIWMTQEEDGISIFLTADRPINLETFAMRKDIDALTEVLDTVVDEKKQ